MDMPEGCDYSLTLYDEYGNQVGKAQWDGEGRKTLAEIIPRTAPLAKISSGWIMRISPLITSATTKSGCTSPAQDGIKGEDADGLCEKDGTGEPSENKPCWLDGKPRLPTSQHRKTVFIGKYAS